MVSIVHPIYEHRNYENHARDHEFSRASEPARASRCGARGEDARSRRGRLAGVGIMKIAQVREQAYSMPLTSPAYPRGPYRFIDRQFLIITYRTEPDRLRAVIPEPLERAGEGAGAKHRAVVGDRGL